MSAEPSTEAMRAARARMLLGALTPETQFEARESLYLREYGLLGRVDDDRRAAVLGSLRTESTLSPFGNGPLLTIPLEDGYGVVELADIICSEDSDLRQLALNRLLSCSQDHSLLGPRARLRIDAAVGHTGSPDTNWRAVAGALYDALEEDFRWTVAGLRQACGLRYQSGLEHFVVGLLRPSRRKLESLDDFNLKPSSSRARIIADFESMADSPTILEVLDRYYSRYGHIPLVSELSIIGAISKWPQPSASSEDDSQQILAWGSSGGYLRSYHSALLLASLRPDSRTDLVLDSVRRFLTIMDDSGSPERLGADLLHALGRHYVCYLPNVLPAADPEVIGVLSLLCARLVGDTLVASGYDLHDILRVTIGPELERSQYYAFVGRPPMGPSPLRHTLLYDPRPWETAFVNLLPDGIMLGAERHIVEQSLVRSLLRLIPRRPDLSTCVYAVELVPVPPGELRGDDSPISGALQVAQTAGTLSVVLEHLHTITERPPVDQLAIAAALRSQVISAEVEPAEVWGVLFQTADGLEHVLLSVELGALDPLLDALIELQARTVDERRYALPHALCSAALKAVDSSRRNVLIGAVVMSCGASDTSSALRQLASDATEQAREVVYSWKDRLTDSGSECSMWSSTRMRRLASSI